MSEERIPGNRALRGLAALVALAIALVCFAWVGWVALDSVLAARALEGALQEADPAAPATARADGAVAPAPAWGALEEGDPIGRVESERLGISVPVFHGVSARTLRRAGGHIPGTARPGEPGNVGVAAHRDTFFRGLAGAAPGDRLTLETPHGIFEYVVESTRVVTPDAVHVLDPPESGELLTLVTCYPFDWVGPAPDRFIVHARRVLEGGAGPGDDGGLAAGGSGAHGPRG